MIFDPNSTSTFGGGLNSVGWKLGDPELENRFEGRCSECGQHGKFNRIAQKCSGIKCYGIMVIETDDMPLARMRSANHTMGQKRTIHQLDND